MEQHNCDLCGKEIKGEEELIGGKCLKFKDGETDIYRIRCDECFAKNQALTNYKKTEVYSRVVGYIRPVQQWNKGKAAEWKDRIEFAVDNSGLT